MTTAIPIEPDSRKFETWPDWFNWSWRTVWAWARLPRLFRAPFARHEDHASQFVYPLAQAPGQPLDVAVFGDFGTGLYYSRYIARHIEHFAPGYAVHLGDVYYTGSEREFDRYVAQVLAPLLDRSRLFVLNGNHEMLSGARPYFRYLERKRAHTGPVPQEQQGSYFCLEGTHVQLIGIDTDYHGWTGGRHRDGRLRAWLASRLQAGRAAGKLNVLMSQNEPYALGSPKLTKLYADLSAELPLVDLWLWGDTHYCALFDRGPQTPFVGSCLGHAGHPYRRLGSTAAAACAAPVRWFEDAPRFPPATGVRQDMGNAGFLMLRVLPGQPAVELRYLDWMRQERKRFSCDRTGLVELPPSP